MVGSGERRFTDFATVGAMLSVVAATWLRLDLIPSGVLIATIAILSAARVAVYAHRTGRVVWSPLTIADLLVNRPPRGGLIPPPLFFLSYLHHNRMSKEDKARVSKFFYDLEHEVSQRSGKLRECGFWDGRLRDGSWWNVKLVQALNSCKVLVALCSPGYYDSDSCAQELDFVQLRASLLADPGQIKAVIKVLWIPGGRPRGTLQFIQDSSLAGNEDSPYAINGLRELMHPPEKKRDEYEQEYRRIVVEKASEIAKTLDGDPYAWDLPSFPAAAILWDKGLAVVHDLAGLAKRDSPGSTLPARASRSKRQHRRPVLVVAALLFSFFSLRAAVMGWAYFEYGVAQDEPDSVKAAALTDQVRCILQAAHAPSWRIQRAEEWRESLESRPQ